TALADPDERSSSSASRLAAWWPAGLEPGGPDPGADEAPRTRPMRPVRPPYAGSDDDEADAAETLAAPPPGPPPAATLSSPPAPPPPPPPGGGSMPLPRIPISRPASLLSLRKVRYVCGPRDPGVGADSTDRAEKTGGRTAGD
ncbi:hypothetical protein THAOC_34111, partial [Thalassiosira oceanica]